MRTSARCCGWPGSEALDVAERVRRQAADLPGAAQLLGAAVAGRAALGAGRLDSAGALLEQAAVGSVRHACFGLGVPLSRSACDCARDVWFNRGGSYRGCRARQAATPFRLLDYELSLARAWVAAGQGAVSEAIAVLLSAAERAALRGNSQRK